MIVGFLNNQLDNRGTGNATFDYAFYNEAILKNRSRIYTFGAGNHSEISVARFTNRFGPPTYISGPQDINDIDVLYHIKYGNDDGFRIDPSIRYAVHAVFNIQPHGDRYAAVSDWLAAGRVPSVPHIVDPLWNRETFREELKIPKSAIVFGRHGGYDTFDISWVWEAIEEVLKLDENVHFVFLNTESAIEHPRVHYLDEAGPFAKRTFLNTCNAMIHARNRGETFGIAIGEFAVLGKPVFTYAKSGERAHLEELKSPQYEYEDTADLVVKLTNFIKEPSANFGYMDYSPNPIMKRFKEVFLDGKD